MRTWIKGQPWYLPNRRFLRHSFTVLVIQFFGFAIVFALQIVLARIAQGADQYGAYAWGQSILFLLGGLLGFGLPMATGRFIAPMHEDRDFRSIRQTELKAIRYILGFSLPVAITFLLLALWLFDTRLPNDIPRSVLILASLFAPIVSLTILLQSVSRSRYWFKLAFIPTRVARPLILLVSVLALWTITGQKLDAMHILILVGISQSLVLLIQLFLYLRASDSFKANHVDRDSQQDAQPVSLLATAFSMYFSRVAGLITEHSGIILLGISGGPLATATYFAATRVSRLTLLPKQIATLVNSPDFSMAHAKNDRQRMQAAVSQTSKAGFWFAALMSVPLVLLGSSILGFFGDEYRNATIILWILVAANLVNAFVGPCAALLNMTGNQNIVAKTSALGATLTIVLLMILLPSYGALGVASTILINNTISGLILVHFSRVSLAINPTIFSLFKVKADS